MTAAVQANASGNWAINASSITSQANSATITATSANTANQIVQRDGSGNFSAGAITANGGGSSLRGTVTIQGGHGDTRNWLQANGGELGTGQTSTMLWWVSEPGITWNGAGFGFNVVNDGGTTNLIYAVQPGFSRINTNFGQAFFRFETDGGLVLYNTTTDGTQTLGMYWGNSFIATDREIRAGRFVDNNNTNYYCDPHSDSQMVRLKIGYAGEEGIYAGITITSATTTTWTTANEFYYLGNTGTGYYPNGATVVALGLYINSGLRAVAGQWMSHSDRRLKNIVNIISEKEGLMLVRDIDPVHYTWKEGVDRDLKSGFIAQDVIRSGFRHLVTSVPNEKMQKETDMYGHTSPEKWHFILDYEQMIPYHHAALKHILTKTDEIDMLKQRITDQQRRIEELEHLIKTTNQ